MKNIILQSDFYKLVHWKMYPQGTENVYSYFESRKGATFPYTVFFGLQYILRKNLAGRVVTQKCINEAKKVCENMSGGIGLFNEKGWKRILTRHNGYLPLRIKAVPEGSLIPENNILMSVENTDPECYWLTNAVESLLTHVWFSSTVATVSHDLKNVIRTALNKSSDNMNGLDFMLHDFGYRGVSSNESAKIGGAAHLINFKGTDTLPAVTLLSEYYGGQEKDVAYSVPATEHSIQTSLGRDGEAALVRQLIIDFPKGILSVVGDSYDICYFVEHIVGNILKNEILARDGVFVVRPDSLTPELPTPKEQVLWILNTLWNKFGGTINNKGYKVLDSHVRVLWADGIDKNDIVNVLGAIIEAGFSAENIATFGMGGGLLQKVNRDTQRFAFKSSWQMRNGVSYDVYKEPKDSSKISKKGRLKLIADGGTLMTVPEDDKRPDLLQTVFLNGKVMKSYTLEEVRKNASTVWHH